MSRSARAKKRSKQAMAARIAAVSLPLLLGLTIACGAPSSNEARGEGDGSLPNATLSAELLADVMQADRQFAQAVADKGLEAWVTAFAEDGSMIPAAGPVTTGHEAIRETMAAAFNLADFSFVWEPQGGAVATAGDLAYTFGSYETRSESELIARGRYVTVWRRGEDGVWKVLADIGNRQSPASDEEP